MQIKLAVNLSSLYLPVSICEQINHTNWGQIMPEREITLLAISDENASDEKHKFSNIIIIIKFQILLSSSNFQILLLSPDFQYYYYRQISNIIIIVKFKKSSSDCTWCLASQSGPTSSFDILQTCPYQNLPRHPDLK